MTMDDDVARTPSARTAHRLPTLVDVAETRRTGL